MPTPNSIQQVTPPSSSSTTSPAQSGQTDMVFDSAPLGTANAAQTAGQTTQTPPQQGSMSDMTFDSVPLPANNVAGSGQTAGTSNPSDRWGSWGTGTLSATPEPDGAAGKVERWARNVADDVKYGTDLTGIGTVLKKMGAHGVYSGNSQEVGDFIASLPLGLLKLGQGEAEFAQPGKRWQGAKDSLSGALQASTIPGAFVAPEAGEAALQTGEQIANQASRAAKTAGQVVTKPFDMQQMVQQPLQTTIRNVLSTVAKDAGVTVSPSASIRDVAADLSTAIRAKSSDLYSQLDAATGGGRFQRFADSLSNIDRGLRDSLGVDPNKYKALVKAKAEVEAAQTAALDAARQAGVDPSLINKANQTWRQQAALSDLSKSLRQTVSGMRPELAKAGSSAETINAKTLFAKVNRLHDSGRLSDAIGPQNSQAILHAADSAYLTLQKVAARNQNLKAAAKAVGLGGLGYEAVKTLHGLLDSQ